MQYTQTENTFIISIEKGEELIETLTSFCRQQGIQNASFSGIGAVEHLSCGYYALGEKKYHFTEYTQLLEVVSLMGNVALKEGKPFVHVHGVFTDTANAAFGGHIASAVSGIVIEVILTTYPLAIERQYNEEIGLFLLSCGK
jgi:predicted DNA-binding protein with PD1-like motif